MTEPRRRRKRRRRKRRRRRDHRLLLRCRSGNVGGGCGLQLMPPRLLSGRWRCFFKGRISRTRNCPVTRGQERVMGLGREHRGSNNSQSWAKCLGLCVVSFIPPAHSAGVSVAMRDKAMNVRKVTINHHMAACENAEFVFKEVPRSHLCYCLSEVAHTRVVLFVLGQINLKALIGAPVQNWCVSLGDCCL